MRLDCQPVPQDEVWRPGKQPGLEEKTAFFLRVYWEPGDGATVATIKEAISMLQSGALVHLDEWIEKSPLSTMGLAFYLVEPTLTNSWQERKEAISRVELLSSVRVVRGLLRASGVLYRQLENQLEAGIDAGSNAPRRRGSFPGRFT